MPTQPEILTSARQYRAELSVLPRFTPSEEREISERARSGDEQARASLIESCLSRVAVIARRYERYIHHDDYLDLVGVGNLALVEYAERALTMDNPRVYLVTVAKCEIINYCMTRASLITKSRYTRIPEMYTSSLDAPISQGSAITLLDCVAASQLEPEEEREEQDYTDLYRALDTLPERHREVLARHYGLYGRPAESLYEMSRAMSAKPGPKSCAAYLTEYRALARLRQCLSTTA